MSEIQIRDNKLIRLKREVSFIKQHVDLLQKAVEEGDINTADFLAGVVLKASTELAKEIKAILSGERIV